MANRSSPPSTGSIKGEYDQQGWLKKTICKVTAFVLCSVVLMGFPVSGLAHEKCPQARQTPAAPQEFLILQNPLSL
jgi:hypothetical protein